VQASVSDDGTTKTLVNSPALSTLAWYFLAERFTPSTELAIFKNDVKTANSTSVVASIYNSTAPFEIARRTVAGTQANLIASMCFVCSAALPDVLLKRFYRLSRGFFGV
jgi:hypothetical protein